ncbi:hypothetical protein C9374_004210 [Naegleria lovaniensis]|uniref:Uncharacterized protein n=1 Tax=Naegleria lovaniensis TaxID=51637 RepID=A0AA88KJ41_NAELO|nr:uncharacterized protein C9374_004210 [Naegleria lovaniensis]KAG2383539.1 hypothetical protein C9374_004210 [Naegleria lovaniensis]
MSEPTNEPFEQEPQTNDNIVVEDLPQQHHVDSAEVNMTTAPIEDINKTESNVADDDNNAHQANLDATPTSTENTLESSSSTEQQANEEQPQVNNTTTENEQTQASTIPEEVTTTIPSSQIAEPQEKGEKDASIPDEGRIDALLESVLGDTFEKIIASTSEKKEGEEEEEIEELQTAGSLANKQGGATAAIHLDDEDEEEEGEPSEADLINILKQLSGNAHHDEEGEHHHHPLNGQTATVDDDDDFEDMNEEEEATAIKMGENLTSMFGKARTTSDHHHSGSSEPGVGWTVAEYALTAAAVLGIGYFLNKVVD